MSDLWIELAQQISLNIFISTALFHYTRPKSRFIGSVLFAGSTLGIWLTIYQSSSWQSVELIATITVLLIDTASLFVGHILARPLRYSRLETIFVILVIILVLSYRDTWALLRPIIRIFQ
jgi:hypothetical protein